LGPLNKSSLFDTGSADFVGSLTTTNKLLFFTDDANTNKGELLDGRGAILLKARATAAIPSSSDYADNLYFTIIGNF